MESATANKSLETVIRLYDWHTKLFKNGLDGISDKDAKNRLNTKANHIKWIAGSLVHQRFEIGRILKIDMKDTGYGLFSNFQGIRDNTEYPSLDDYRKDWDKISPLLKDELLNVSDDVYNGPDPFEMPGGDYKFSDTIVFMVDRESYCIGQIGLFRRLLGYDAIKFD